MHVFVAKHAFHHLALFQRLQSREEEETSSLASFLFALEEANGEDSPPIEAPQLPLISEGDRQWLEELELLVTKHIE